MNTTNANVPIVARRPMRWAVLVGGIAVGFATGLLTAKSFSFSANAPKAAFAAKPTQPAAPVPATSEIVPSPVIEANPQFFFGTGDGGAGYYSDRQAR